MAIYELNKEIQELLEIYDSCFNDDWELINEELYNATQKKLEELQNQKDDLKDWQLKKRANTIANINGINLEIKRLQDLKEKQNKEVVKSDKFLEFLFKDTIKDKKILFGNFEIGYSKSKRLEILDEKSIDNKYKVFIEEQVIPASYKVDKNVLKDFIKKGEEINGCELREILTFKIN